jgi:hypothetical protein
MSLRVDSTKIYIENSAGTTKFDSSQRLVFRSGQKTGSTTIGATDFSKQISHGLTFDPDEHFYNLYITITACSGSAVADLIDVRLPANNQLCVDLDTTLVSGQVNAKSTMLSAAVSKSELVFTYGTHMSGIPNWNDAEYFRAGFSISFDYELFLFRYSS